MVCMLASLAAHDRRPPVNDMPMLPGASLLVGSPPFFLMVTNAHESLKLEPEYRQPDTRDSTAIHPSISRDEDARIAGRYLRSRLGKACVISIPIRMTQYGVPGNERVPYFSGSNSP